MENYYLFSAAHRLKTIGFIMSKRFDSTADRMDDDSVDFRLG